MLANILKSKNLKAIHNAFPKPKEKWKVGKYPEIKELESNSQQFNLYNPTPASWQIS